MKNLGLRSGLQLLGMVAGICSLARAAVPSWAVAPPRRGSRAADHPERGDVPGWVMITLMSAVLVAALLALAGPALETMFNQAMDKVGN
jgi:type VI protein secretion system component VasF